MLPAARPERRQLWDVDATTTTSSVVHHCTPFTLPSLGIISVNPTSSITLDSDAVFTPECTATFDVQNAQSGGPTSTSEMRDPFNASVTPQVYATGAATVIAWMLVIMLLITPRTFFVGGAGGTSGLLGRRGMISGATGGSSIIGVGSRPWLQKVAALTVAVSMTMATADTFRVAEQQYESGYMNAIALRDQVVGGLEIKLSRIISDIFLWLAQVQTLIRLFSRHKEKVIIKWVGFALIILDMTFSTLNSFIGNTTARARHFENAIPALNYLFQCALSMLYAAWVLYYAITKRRYAFYHSMMWNISLVALLSIVAILTPLAFFITDISNYNVAGWGDYFRWVGAAAASVIVWEWVERIEALEREEKKDGILGREVFDGDEMLEHAASNELNWPRNRSSHHRQSRPGGGSVGAYSSGYASQGSSTLGIKSPLRHSTLAVPPGRLYTYSPGQKTDITEDSRAAFSGYAHVPTPPPAIASPISRTDTTSTSTVYTVRYHTLNEPFPPQARPMPRINHPAVPSPTNLSTLDEKEAAEMNLKDRDTERQHITSGPRFRWASLPNPFKKRKASPPQEVLGGRVIESLPIDSPRPPAHNYSRWDLKSRLGAFAAEQSEKFRERATGAPVEMDLPVTIIPAQPRGRTWSPDSLENQQEQEQQASQAVEGERAGAAGAAATQHFNEEGIATLGIGSIVPASQSISPSNQPHTAEAANARASPQPANAGDQANLFGGPELTPSPSSPRPRSTNPFSSPPLSPMPATTTPALSDRSSVTPNAPGRPEAGPSSSQAQGPSR